MSERQAKLKRKNQDEKQTVKTTKKSDIITNIIITIVIIAMVALGSWAIYSKYKSATDTDATETAQEDAVQLQTVGDVAAGKDLSTDEFIAEYGLENVEGISADMDFQTAMQSMTIENYAKYLDQDIDELIGSIDVDAEITPDMTVGEVVELVSAAQAENSDSETETSDENE